MKYIFLYAIVILVAVVEAKGWPTGQAGVLVLVAGAALLIKLYIQSAQHRA